jgi:hypothetical protein
MLDFKPKPKMNDYSFIRLSYVQYLVKTFPDIFLNLIGRSFTQITAETKKDAMR